MCIQSTLYCVVFSGGPADVKHNIIYDILYMCVLSPGSTNNTKDQQQKSYIHNQMIYAQTKVKVYILFLE